MLPGKKFCALCESYRPAASMYNVAICIVCNAGQRTALANKTGQKSDTEQQLKKTGAICEFCHQQRLYIDFKLHSVSRRIMVHKPCVYCRLREEQKRLGLPDDIRPTIKKRGRHRFQACVLCNVIRNQRNCFGTDPRVCDYCAETAITMRCHTCQVEYHASEMMPNNALECIYCVLRYRNVCGMTVLRRHAVRDRVCRIKIRDFIMSMPDYMDLLPSFP